MNIVGMGCISALGEGVETLLRLHDQPLPIPDFVFSENYLKDTRFYQGVLPDAIAQSAFQLSLCACKQALEDANLKTQKIALVIASGAGDTSIIEMPVEYQRDDYRSPYQMAERLSEALDLQGVFCCVSNACASSGYALKVVEDLLSETCDAVLLCGVEAKSITTQATFKTLLVLDSESCRPFSEDRNGTVLGCGAAALLFVKKSQKTERSYASVQGMAMSCDAYHPTSPEPLGKEITRSIKDALRNADVNTMQVSIFVPHATGTKLNDDIEYKLLKSIFSDQFSIQSSILLKQYIGHTGGASAAFSLLAASLGLSRQPELEGHAAIPAHALVLCTAFGGNNFSAILRQVTTQNVEADQ